MGREGQPGPRGGSRRDPGHSGTAANEALAVAGIIFLANAVIARRVADARG
jgi:hypothetical protein